MNTPHVTEESGTYAVDGKAYTHTVYDFLKPKVAHLDGWDIEWAEGWTERTAWDAVLAECEAFIAERFPTAVHSGMGYWKVARQYRIFYNQGRVIVERMGSHA